ncbi:RHS repeat domain-containing protein [Flavobacterium cupriresistens]|uniref:RHS repeat domain-containing protein n=1 Tax=Flavobacterium cupriresistens TaxID=2893885 RepID=UPI002105B191|nr:RHS repeat-associated core domain-containing protein [Flavobacterium sp. F-323]
MVQENNYYAFGLTQKGYNGIINGIDNKYKFNGIEESKDLELNLLHPTKFRTYDPAIARFNGIDPLADKSNNITPYSFVMNNPILYSDLTGADTTKLREIVVYTKKQVSNAYSWFTGTNVGYTGSGWGHGLRRSLANQIGIGNRANNIFELGLQSQLQAKQVNLGGPLLNKIKEDEGMIKFQNDIIKALKTDPRFKKLQFIMKGKGVVEFGGKRWSSSNEDWGALNNNNPVFHGETWAVGSNQLTWVTRHASMSYSATVKSDGTIVVDFQLKDTFDLSGQKGRSEAYNNISNTAGFLYHDVVGGNNEMQINGNWQIENKN